jgi:hypothetical protein
MPVVNLYLERHDACVEVINLYGECGCVEKELQHHGKHLHGPKSCNHIQQHYTIQNHKCDKCSRNRLRPGARRFYKAIGLRGMLDRQDRDRERFEELRQFRLVKWKDEIGKYEAFKKAWMEEHRALDSFKQQLHATRVREELQDTPLDDRPSSTTRARSITRSSLEFITPNQPAAASVMVLVKES